jgi:hypothetical protein
MKRTDQLLCATFLVAISVPVILQIRAPAQLFTKDYGKHFGGRAELIRWHARLMYDGLGISPSDQVWLGRDGWLYYANDYSEEDYRSAKPFSTAELERWRQVLEERAAWLARRHARFVVVWACDKYVIYPEHLPAGLRRAPGPYRVEQLANDLATNSTVTQVALREPLLAGKATDRLYHRTDTHWNDRGAFIGYREILARLGLQLLAYDPVEVQTPGWDLARMLELADRIPEADRQLRPREPRRAQIVEIDRPDPTWNVGRVALEVADPALPRLVMFRDSFGSALVPFLAEHFRRSLFLWQYDFDPDVIEREQPDVVIWLMTSRRLQWYDPVNPPLQ